MNPHSPMRENGDRWGKHISDGYEGNSFIDDFPIHKFHFDRDYKIIGGTGSPNDRTIMKVFDKEKKIDYVVKIFLKSNIIKRGRKSIQQVNMEASILRQLKHPFIVKFISSWQSTNKLYLGMEYLPGGELFDLWKVLLIVSDNLIRFISAQIALALDYIHYNHILYRDLKMENVMFDHLGYVKLIDFGASKQFHGNSNDRTWTVCGTLAYAAPEILNGNGYTYPVDWWALGIFCCALSTGVYPINPTVPHNQMRVLVNEFSYQTPSNTSEELGAVIKGLLKKHPEHRIYGCERLQSLPFYRTQINFNNLEKRMYNPFSFYTDEDITRMPDGWLKNRTIIERRRQMTTEAVNGTGEYPSTMFNKPNEGQPIRMLDFRADNYHIEREDPIIGGNGGPSGWIDDEFSTITLKSSKNGPLTRLISSSSSEYDVRSTMKSHTSGLDRLYLESPYQRHSNDPERIIRVNGDRLHRSDASKMYIIPQGRWEHSRVPQEYRPFYSITKPPSPGKNGRTVRIIEHQEEPKVITFMTRESFHNLSDEPSQAYPRLLRSKSTKRINKSHRTEKASNVVPP